METEKTVENFVRNLLFVLPSWHSKLVRPFKDTLQREMSLETYYCLQTLRMCTSATMTELAQRLKVPKQQATKLVDKLIGCQFVERVQNEGDRRVIRIRLTDKALHYLDDYYLKNTAFIASLEQQLTAEDLLRLNDAVEVLGEILPKLR